VKLVLALAAGMLLGAVFFGGLWWTIRTRLNAPRPALWLLGSLIVRLGIVLTGFYAVSDNQWEQLLACLLGFGIARLVLTWLVGRESRAVNAPHKAISHAP
jgi:F1F0 ATPase subunit 2